MRVARRVEARNIADHAVNTTPLSNGERYPAPRTQPLAANAIASALQSKTPHSDEYKLYTFYSRLLRILLPALSMFIEREGKTFSSNGASIVAIRASLLPVVRGFQLAYAPGFITAQQDTP
jgi:hypothetical protein